MAKYVSLLNALLFSLFTLASVSYGQASNTWLSAGQLTQARTGAAAVLLQDGRILITGGSDSNGVPQASTEMFDPATGQFSPAASMNVARANHAAIVLTTGDVLVTGGVTDPGGDYTNSAEIFSVRTQHWTQLQATLPQGLTGHAMALLADGNVLIAGGQSTTGPVSTLLLFNASDDSITSAGTLTTARTNAAAAATPDGRVLIAGGADINNNVLASTEIFVYSPATVTGTISAGPAMTYARTAATATATYDGVAIIGGYNIQNGTQTDLGTAEIFSQWTNAFRVISGGTPRSGHFAVRLPNNGAILAMGGTGAQAVDLLEPWANGTAGAFVAASSSLSNQTGGFAAPATLGSILAAGGQGSSASSAELYWFPTIATDQSDYAPGTPVVMTGSGFQPGENVDLHLHEWVNQTVTDLPDYTVLAGSNGIFSFTGYAPTTSDIGARYHLTAIGETSALQAQTIFTDGNDTISFATSGLPAGTSVTVNFFPKNTQQQTGTTVTFSSPGPTSGQGETPGQNLSYTFPATLTVNGTTYNLSTTPPSVSPSASSCSSPQSGYAYCFIASSAGNVNYTVTGAYVPAITTITPSVTASNKTYDGSSTATITGCTLTGVQSADVGNVTCAAAGPNTFASANVANGITVTATNITLGGSAASKYVLSRTSATTTANITPAPLTVSVIASNKQYDTTTAATLNCTVTGGLISPDISTCSATGTFADANAGNGKTVNISSVTVSNSNYNIPSPPTTAAANITPAPLTVSVTGVDKQYDGKTAATLNCTVTGGLISPDTSTCSASGTFADANAGSNKTINISSVTATNTNYNIPSPPATATANITRAPLTVAVTGSQTYGGNNVAFTPNYAGSVFVNGENSSVISGTLTCNSTASATSPVIGSYTVSSCSGLAAANYSISYSYGTFTINAAPLVITVSGTQVYGGTGKSFTPVSYATFVNGENAGVLTGALSCTTDATATSSVSGNPYTVSGCSGLADTNYNISYASGGFTVTQATASVVVAPYTVTYNGQPHTATLVSITGVNGETGATVGTVDLSHTTNTNAGTYTTDYWSFTGTANYSNIGKTYITDTINQAIVTAAAGTYTGVYDGKTHSPSACQIVTATALGFKGDLACTNSPDPVGPNVGSGTVTPQVSGDQTNFIVNSRTNSWSITPATASVVVAPYTVTYNGQPHTATLVSITGVNGETGATVGTVDLSHTTNTNAGTYTTDYWTFTGTANYSNIGATYITDTINKTIVTAAAGTYTGVYDGKTHSPSACQIVTATALGFKGDLACTNSPDPVGPGVGSGTVTPQVSGDQTNFIVNPQNNSWSITPATASVVVAPYTVTYNGQPHTATLVSITGVNGETGATVGMVDLSHTTNTNAGTYTTDYWTFTGTANYSNIGATYITDTINKAIVTAAAGTYTGVYDGKTHSPSACQIVTATALGFKGDLACTNSPDPVGPGVGSGTVTPQVSGDQTNFIVNPRNNSWSITPAMTVISNFASSANPSVYDQPVTFSATVTNESTPIGVSEGTVTFVDANSNTPLCSATPVAGGASCSTVNVAPYLAVGTHTIDIVYSDSLGNFLPSADPSAGTQTVNVRHTTVSITSSLTPNPFASGSVSIDTAVPVTITVTDDDPNGTPITPTGTFSITSSVMSDTFSPSDASGNGQCVLTGTGSSASCILTLTPVEADQHDISAVYPGDAPHANGSQKATLLVTAPLQTQKMCIATPFNGTAIPAGSTVWFNGVFQTNGPKITTLTHLTFYNQTIQIGNNGPVYPVPDGVIVFDPSATKASTTFDATNNRWNTTLPTYNLAGKNWLSGMPVSMPAGLPGSTAPVTWCGQFASDSSSLALGWQWAAAVYTNFESFDPNDPSDLNGIGVKSVDDNKADANYQNSDHAGTPENYLKYVIGGARGGGGGNYTGGYSGNGSVK